MCQTSRIGRLLLLPTTQATLCCALLLLGHRRAVGAATSPVAADAGIQQGATPSGPSEIFARGKRALQGGELAKAEECFRLVIQMDPRSAAAHTNLGVVYMRERRWDDALVELGRARTLQPGDPGVDLDIGLAYYRESNFTMAIEPFQRSLQEAPSSQARYLLGLCYFFTSDYRQASETLAPLWETQSGNPNYLYVLSIAASKVADAAMQKRAFEQMLAIGQNTPEFHLYLGKAWLAVGDTDKALEEFTAAALARPGLPLVHYFLGRTYLEKRNFNLALDELLKDAALEPNFAYDYEDLGILYAQMGEPAKAEELFEKALARNAFLVNSCFGLAKIYRESGRFKEALAMLDRAERMVPRSASLHYTRGQVLARLGEPDKAKQEFARSAALLHDFNDRLQQGTAGDISADAESASEQ